MCSVCSYRCWLCLRRERRQPPPLLSLLLFFLSSLPTLLSGFGRWDTLFILCLCVRCTCTCVVFLSNLCRNFTFIVFLSMYCIQTDPLCSHLHVQIAHCTGLRLLTLEQSRLCVKSKHKQTTELMQNTLLVHLCGRGRMKLWCLCQKQTQGVHQQCNRGRVELLWMCKRFD